MSFLELLRKDAQGELRFYLFYHSNVWNWRLHWICVPLEWFTWLVVLAVGGQYPSLAAVAFAGLAGGSSTGYIGQPQCPPLLGPPLVVIAALITAWAGINTSILVSVVCASYFVVLCPNWLGFATAASQLVMGIGAVWWVQHVGWGAAIIVHLASWILQVGVGHRVLEQNEPGMKETPYSALALSLLIPISSCESVSFFSLSRPLPSQMKTGCTCVRIVKDMQILSCISTL